MKVETSHEIMSLNKKWGGTRGTLQPQKVTPQAAITRLVHKTEKHFPTPFQLCFKTNGLK